MCKNHVHKRLISEIHSTAERELFCFDKSLSVADDENVRARRAELVQRDRQSLLALGDALAFQMRYNEALRYYEQARDAFPDDYSCHRKCGARYMSVLNIDAAEREFLWCLNRTDDKLDINYRLALCAYFRGDFAKARDGFSACYALCRENGEMYIAVLYWHIQCLVRLRESLKPALNYYYDGLDGGHHVGYMQTVKLFLCEEPDAAYEIDCEDELNLSIYRYGYYAYLLYKGLAYEAVCELEAMLKLNTYFSSFAYLGAFSEKARLRERSFNRLREFFKERNKIAIAFSGGTDSALLLSVAKSAGADVKAYLVRSGFQPEFEIADARRLADELRVDFEIIDIPALSDNSIVINDEDRCYYCKLAMFSKLKDCAERDGYDTVIDGTNASDNVDDRPGYRAIKQLGVISPLRDCGLTKSDVRCLSKKSGLFTFDKPSYSCLATRVAEGERITQDILDKIESAETLLKEMGYADFRVRYLDRCAKIEINKNQNDKFQTEKDKIFAALSQYFDSVKQSDILR